MAYLAFEEAGGAAPAASRAEGPAVRFSPLEWWTIAAAQRERLSTLKEPGPIARLLGAVFGANDNDRNVDPRQQALRRMAILAWHKSYTVPKWEIQAFVAAGFSLDHYELLQASIATARSRSRRARGAGARRPARREWIALEPAHGLS